MIKFTRKPSGALSFLFVEVFNYNLNFLTDIYIQIFHFFLSQFWLCLSRNVCIIQVIKFTGVKLLHISLCFNCLWNLYWYIPPFIPDSNNLGFLFPLICLVRGSSLLLLFPRNNFWICWFSPLFAHFPLHWFLLLLFSFFYFL